MADFSSLVLHEGTALYALARWQFREVISRGYFVGFGHKFIIVRDPHCPRFYTVIEEETGLRIEKDFCYRSVGAAFDRAKDVIYDNQYRLDCKVTTHVGLAQRTFLQRNRYSLSPAIASVLWK